MDLAQLAKIIKTYIENEIARLGMTDYVDTC